MKRLILFPLLILCCAAQSNAEIYTWTDDQGVVTFTDNPAQIPSRFSGRTRNGDITTIHMLTFRKTPGRGEKRPQAIIPGNRTKSVAADSAEKKQREYPCGH